MITRPAGGRRTLLVVDDQPVNVQILYRALSGDYQVLMATSGRDAIELCRAQPPDLVLLDIGMPDIDGHEVCRRLKADATTRAIPVIFVTAHDDPAQEAIGFELGAVDFISKPVNPSVVRARVGTHLSLAHSRSLLAATLQATADGILVTDLDGGIITSNAGFAQMWELPAGGDADAVRAVMAQRLLDADQAPPSWAAPEQEGGCTAVPRTIELRGERTFEWQARPLFINAKRAGSVTCFRDVTQQARAARELTRVNATLEDRILERTAELELALQQAGADSRAKSDFLSNMSHEIRTPMNGVIGMTHLALRAGPSPEQRSYLEKIQGAGEHLMHIINDILDFSKIEAGRMALDQQVVSLTELVDTVAGQTQHLAKAKNLEFSLVLDPAIPRRLRGDGLRIKQVLLNLVGNAIKFTEQGGVRLRVTMDPGTSSGPKIRFEIADDGIGMTDAQVARSFQFFQQADTSTARKYGGTGLGLAISKRLTSLMGGEIGVSSRLGAGSTFWFTLPLREAPADDVDSAPDPSAMSPEAEPGRLFGARILLAEDNPLNAEVAGGLLEAVGATVRLAEDGRAALKLLATETFDAVLMDMQMPVMDGLETTRRIRANPAWAKLPIIAMTANASHADRESCLRAGMNDFTTKPVHPERLYEILSAWLPERAEDDRRAYALQAAAGAVPTPASMPTPMPIEHLAVLDLSILSVHVGGRQDRVERYVTQFADSVPETVAELEAELASEDLPALSGLGHRLKSSARMVGALRLAVMCEALEALNHRDEIDRARSLVDKLTTELTAVVGAVVRVYGSSRSLQK